MNKVSLKRLAWLGGRFIVSIDGKVIDDNCTEVLVGDCFHLRIQEYKVFSNTTTYKQELVDVALLRKYGSWDDILPPNYTTYSCNISIPTNANLKIRMDRALISNKNTRFVVTLSDGIISDERIINGINYFEFIRYEKFSKLLYRCLLMSLVLFSVVATIFVGWSALPFLAGIEVPIALIVYFRNRLYIKRLRETVGSSISH